MSWGPYAGQGEARQRLTAFANAVFHRPVGVLWTADNQTMWLRPPAFDGANDGLALMVRCDPAPPPPPLALPSMQKVETALMGAWKTASMFTPIPSPEGVAALNKYVLKPTGEFLDRHPLLKDGVIVVADVVGVIAGIAALFTIATVGGTVAVVAGLIATIVAGGACALLLFEDAQHAWFTALGDKAARLRLEARPDYQWIQAIAPWFTLPDLLAGGRTVAREAAEASKQAATVMARARILGVASQNASREARQIIIDPEQDWQIIKAARDEAMRRTNDYRRMSALAQRESMNLIVRRNAVLATAGSAFAARQYVHEPPVLTERAFDNAKEKLKNSEDDAHKKAEKALGSTGGSACRPGSIGHLLTPSTPRNGSNTHLHMHVVVTHWRSAVRR